MQNINELIGIIKGINFDGIINDMEVLHLQSWVAGKWKGRYDVCTGASPGGTLKSE